MFSTISLAYPLWFILLCLLTGAIYALGLYYREKSFDETSKWMSTGLGILRFIAVSLIAFLLLSPVLKSNIVETKKPIVVIAQDNSESIQNGLGKDSSNYNAKLRALKEQLSTKYEVQDYSFGSSVKPGLSLDYQDKTSNISAIFDEFYDLYANQNLGAVILATDGIYNEGSNPLYSSSKLNVPVFSIALGDTVARRDLFIKKLFSNRIAYLGDKFSIEVDIAASNCSGSISKISIARIEGANASIVQEKPININSNDFFQTETFILDADKPGVLRYRITAQTINGEASTLNNSVELFIDVLDARQKILILANAPHPDLSALKASLSENKNYLAEIQYANKFTGGVDAYDFVILHQVPGTTSTAEATINALKAKKIPRLFILGAQSNLVALANAQGLLSVRGNIAQTNEVSGKLVPGFSLFKLNEQVAPILPKFPPLVTPFGEYKATGNATTLLTQRIGNVETAYPLLVMGEEQGAKVGVLAGEGIWKWRLFDYLQHKNHEIYHDIIGKTINYLAIKEDKRRFRTYSAKNIYNENEPIIFDAELYNASYELVNEPDAFLQIKDESGKKYDFTFSKTSNAYSLNTGLFPVGNYSFEAKTTYNKEAFKVEGKFSVQPIQLELYNTRADHQLLRLMSEKVGGKTFTMNNMDQIMGSIEANGELPALRYESTKTRSIINLKWLFFLILGLLSTEWFARRYFGSY